MAARAGAIVRRLRAAWSQAPGEFRPRHEGGTHAVVFLSREGRGGMGVISVSRGDARAYQRRSNRPVTPDLLAAYWSDLLSDYWSVAFQGEAATRLVGLHEGEALRALSEQLAGTSGHDAEPFAAAVRLSPPALRYHLWELATSVPRQFADDGAHEVKTR